VVPKGIHEPGLSSKESAAQEAFEEAGVEGLIGEEAVGHYEYQKWEAMCRVVVYPMLVKRIIPEPQWAEAHRGRRWCSPQEAAELVRQRELAPLIEKLAAKANPV
jgi:phosphohistidine phosphatase